MHLESMDTLWKGDLFVQEEHLFPSTTGILHQLGDQSPSFCLTSAEEVKGGNQKEMEVSGTGWLWSYSWEGKSVEEPEQQEKPNHGNVFLTLQMHSILRCY